MATEDAAARQRRYFNRDVAAGVFLLVVAATAVAGSWPLLFGRLASIGPGLMPRSTAVILGAFGLALVVQGMTRLGDRLEAWSLRGVLLVLGGVAFFAATIRPLGLAVAGPVAVVLAALADPATRLREIVPFALALTAASVLLFKLLLRQPIPVAPWAGW